MKPHDPARTLVIGIDIGQRRDPTAICVAEVELRPGPTRPEEHYLIRHLDRMPLGTPYPEIARRLRDLTARIAQCAGVRPRVYVDATGVGLPVVDGLKAMVTAADVGPVFLTHGDRRREVNGEVRLGKARLVCRLQALLQAGRLHLPRTREADALAAELLTYEIRVSRDAHDRYGAFRVGTHDDLATALGLAVQDGALTVPRSVLGREIAGRAELSTGRHP
jgi:hypothetical protein